MKKIIYLPIMLAALGVSAEAYVGTVNCKDNTGKVRISFQNDWILSQPAAKLKFFFQTS